MNKKVELAVQRAKDYMKDNDHITQDFLDSLIQDLQLSDQEYDDFLESLTNIAETTKSTDEDKTVDLSRTDYDQLFEEVLSIAPNLEDFINYVKNIPPPHGHETSDLLNELKNGNNKVKDRIVQMHLRPIIKQALTYSKDYKYDLEDSIAEGIISIYRAIDKYQGKKKDNGYFLSYLSLTFQTNIQRYGKSIWIDVYYPVHIQEKIDKAIRFYFSNHLIEDDINEDLNFWAKEFTNVAKGIDIDTSKELLKLVSNKINHSKSYYDLDNNDFLFSLDDTDKLDFTHSVIERNLHDAIDLKGFSDKEKTVLTLRFGLDGNNEHTLEEVGSIFHVSRERIRQIQKNALKKLKVRFIHLTLDDFI